MWQYKWLKDERDDLYVYLSKKGNEAAGESMLSVIPAWP